LEQAHGIAVILGRAQLALEPMNVELPQNPQN
jgi:hypothetical protein